MNSHINITLIINDKKYDLRIPTQQTAKKLIFEIMNIYNLELNRENYNIKVLTKDTVILENELLNNYPLSNGDILKLI